ncbi:hypothetical protein BD311DRAFT_751883 [Dichomitus squalens]|uniref:Uncharacterized protein n=1 Tax=Dichomitus squalens TaxID=114155 RepID=A0A4Q9MW40_9APHY|nr:hypothetical protein BD311DRAFT_751883 [Dichomitus squalens]
MFPSLQAGLQGLYRMKNDPQCHMSEVKPCIHRSAPKSKPLIVITLRAHETMSHQKT